MKPYMGQMGGFYYGQGHGIYSNQPYTNQNYQPYGYGYQQPSYSSDYGFVVPHNQGTPHHNASIRGNLGSKMGLIRKRVKISFCELEFKNR